jgi:hypothetical protein
MSDDETSELVASLRGNARLILPAARATQQLHEYEDHDCCGLISWTSRVVIYADTLRVDSSVFGIFECLGVINTPAVPAPNADSVTYVLIYKNYYETDQSKQYKAAWFEKDGFDKLCGRFPEVASLIRSYVHVAGERQVLEAFCKSKSSGACERAGSVPTSIILSASMPRVTKNGDAYRLFDGAQSNPAPQPMAAATSIAGAPTPPTVQSPPAPAPLALTEDEKMWRDAPDARKVFWVTSNKNPGIAGYYSYKEPGVWLKAGGMNAALEECTLKLTGTQRAVVYNGTAVVVSCNLSTTGSCNTWYHTVKSVLRPTSGMWNGASTLQMTWLGGEILNFVPVELSVGLKMRDVWRSQNMWFDTRIKSGIYWYLTESGCPHVGGPPRRAETENEGYVLYRYEELRLTYHAYWSYNDRSWKWQNSTAPCDIVVRSVTQ